MNSSLYDTLDSYDFELDRGQIAQVPCMPRDHSRLLIVDRRNGSFTDAHFYDLPTLLTSDDLLVVNRTKVIKAQVPVQWVKRSSNSSFESTSERLYASNPTSPYAAGSSSDLVQKNLLLVEYVPSPGHVSRWYGLIKGSGRLREGHKLQVAGSNIEAKVLQRDCHGRVLVEFPLTSTALQQLLESHAQMPLPPYIERKRPVIDDERDYQTPFGREFGSVASPTASLHFTPRILENLTQKGIASASVTLHVGMGTFAPVRERDLTKHKMHGEHYRVDDGAVIESYLNDQAKRVIAVGTTVCRCLESAPDLAQGRMGVSEIFIRPGYHFKRSEALITNFHLPKSTLLMLVCAFGGYDLMMEAYRYASRSGYRFFSYGDAMIIL